MAQIRYWIFQANPKYYNLAGAVQAMSLGDEDEWTTSQYAKQMHAGDKVALWQGGKHAGVYALGELLAVPRQRTQHADWQIAAGLTSKDPGLAVAYRVTALYSAGIPRDVIKMAGPLGELSILKMANGTNFKVTPEQWQALKNLAQQFAGEGKEGKRAPTALYRLVDNDGHLLDATFELEDSALILHSRGGARGKNARNTEYSKALRLLLERLHLAALPVSCAWVDSSNVQALPIEDRMILSPADKGLSPLEAFRQMSAAMERVGRMSDVTIHGNRTKRIRIELERKLSPSELIALLRAVPVPQGSNLEQRLPASELEKVTPAHLLNAVQRIWAGYTDHGFGASTDYDILLEDGKRLPPKAVFGVAASEALGFKVLPVHFTGGKDSTSFRLLKQAGFIPVPKEGSPETMPFPTSNEDLEWTEGRKVLVLHLKSERASGVAKAKKVDFKRVHGRLFCEHCGMEPETVYGEYGESCIEVHHGKVQVKDMLEQHVTVLSDLQCLCANCHRVEHQRLKAKA